MCYGLLVTVTVHDVIMLLMEAVFDGGGGCIEGAGSPIRSPLAMDAMDHIIVPCPYRVLISPVIVMLSLLSCCRWC